MRERYPKAKTEFCAGSSQAGLGTGFTTEEDFRTGRLREKYGLEIHRVVYEKLCVGKILDSSHRAFVAIVERLRKAARKE